MVVAKIDPSIQLLTDWNCAQMLPTGGPVADQLGAVKKYITGLVLT